MDPFIAQIVVLCEAAGVRFYLSPQGLQILPGGGGTIPIFSPVDFKDTLNDANVHSTVFAPMATLRVTVRSTLKSVYSPIAIDPPVQAPNPPPADPAALPIPFPGALPRDRVFGVLDAVDIAGNSVNNQFSILLPKSVDLTNLNGPINSWQTDLVFTGTHNGVIQFRAYNAQLGPAYAAMSELITLNG